MPLLLERADDRFWPAMSDDQKRSVLLVDGFEDLAGFLAQVGDRDVVGVVLMVVAWWNHLRHRLVAVGDDIASV